MTIDTGRLQHVRGYIPVLKAACQHGHWPVLNLLLPVDGYAANQCFEEAIASQDLSVIQLIAESIRVKLITNIKNCLMKAVATGSTDIVECILDYLPNNELDMTHIAKAVSLYPQNCALYDLLSSKIGVYYNVEMAGAVGKSNNLYIITAYLSLHDNKDVYAEVIAHITTEDVAMELTDNYESLNVTKTGADIILRHTTILALAHVAVNKGGDASLVLENILSKPAQLMELIPSTYNHKVINEVLLVVCASDRVDLADKLYVRTLALGGYWNIIRHPCMWQWLLSKTIVMDNTIRQIFIRVAPDPARLKVFLDHLPSNESHVFQYTNTLTIEFFHLLIRHRAVMGPETIQAMLNTCDQCLFRYELINDCTRHK